MDALYTNLNKGNGPIIGVLKGLVIYIYIYKGNTQENS